MGGGESTLGMMAVVGSQGEVFVGFGQLRSLYSERRVKVG